MLGWTPAIPAGLRIRVPGDRSGKGADVAMTSKERFLRTLAGSGADRFPFYDLDPAEDTLRRWRRQGLPRGRSVAEVFGLEPHHAVGLILRSAPFYGDARDLLTDPTAFARHYDEDDPERLPRGFAARCRRVNRRGEVLYIEASGGGLLQKLGVRDWDSLVRACYAMADRPAEVEDLLERTTDLQCQLLERALSELTVDYASLYEPIASNAGPVVSPAMFQRFAMPGYRRILAVLERHEVPLRILCTTGGDLSALLPPLLEAGVNGLWISNIASALMGYQQLRRAFGPEIALIGGIDATVLTRDDAAVRAAVAATVPPLLAEGHYLPCLDDRPRSNVPFARYKLYRKLLAEIAGS